MQESDTDHTGAVPRRRGRPSRRDAKAMDERILEAAWTSFTAAGFAGTTMDDVAHRAGVTKATLYARHDGKAALLEAVIRDRLAQWTSRPGPRGPVGETLEARLRHYGRTMLQWTRRDDLSAIGRLLRGGGLDEALANRLHAVLRAPMVDTLSRHIAEASNASGDREQDARLKATIFLSMLLGYAMARADEALPEIDEDTFIDLVVQQFVHGMAGAPDS